MEIIFLPEADEDLAYWVKNRKQSHFEKNLAINERNY
jgi:hypothetical protein